MTTGMLRLSSSSDLEICVLIGRNFPGLRYEPDGVHIGIAIYRLNRWSRSGSSDNAES